MNLTLFNALWEAKDHLNDLANPDFTLTPEQTQGQQGFQDLVKGLLKSTGTEPKLPETSLQMQNLHNIMASMNSSAPQPVLIDPQALLLMEGEPTLHLDAPGLEQIELLAHERLGLIQDAQTPELPSSAEKGLENEDVLLTAPMMSFVHPSTTQSQPKASERDLSQATPVKTESLKTLVEQHQQAQLTEQAAALKELRTLENNVAQQNLTLQRQQEQSRGAGKLQEQATLTPLIQTPSSPLGIGRSQNPIGAQERRTETELRLSDSSAPQTSQQSAFSALQEMNGIVEAPSLQEGMSGLRDRRQDLAGIELLPKMVYKEDTGLESPELNEALMPSMATSGEKSTPAPAAGLNPLTMQQTGASEGRPEGIDLESQLTLSRTQNMGAALTAQDMFKTPAQQVEIQLKNLAHNKQQRITVKLYPESLGRVDVSLQVGLDGRSQVIINAQQGETLDLLRRDAHILQSSLQEAGIQLDASGMSFNLSQHQDAQQDASFKNAAPLYQSQELTAPKALEMAPLYQPQPYDHKGTYHVLA